jgi:hypothetical protein
MEEMYCQSCGMPLVKAEDFATNKDGTPMSEYCIYCFKDGDFFIFNLTFPAYTDCII